MTKASRSERDVVLHGSPMNAFEVAAVAFSKESFFLLKISRQQGTQAPRHLDFTSRVAPLNAR